MLQDGDLERAVAVHDGGDARREVGRIGLEFAGHAAVAEAALLDDGVGLVAVRHDERIAHRAHGMVDDQARVGEQRRVVRLGADAVVGQREDAVAAVGAAPHDEVVHDAVANRDAAPRIRIVPEDFRQILHVRLQTLVSP